VPLLGTSPLFSRGFEHHPDLLADLSDDRALRARSGDELLDLARRSLSWRQSPEERRHGLSQLRWGEWQRVAANDVLGLADLAATERSLTSLAETIMQTALDEVGPSVPFAVVAMGRFGGAELS